MLSWESFAKSAPEMAQFGVERMAERVMYLGTINKKGYPRVHPFTPFVAGGHLYAFMEPTSPKGHDLRRDPRYTIHSLVKDINGSDGEFSITGGARAVEDPETRVVAAKGCPYTPADRYVLFEFLVEECFVNHYVGGSPSYSRWSESGAKR